MGLGIKQIQRGSEICLKWAASIKRSPATKGILKAVTIDNDNARKTIGKLDDVRFVILKKPNGYTKAIIKSSFDNSSLKIIKYPDGSLSKTTYMNGVKPRTNGQFIVKKKDGSTDKIGYGVDGEFGPTIIKKLFISNLEKFSDPKYEVDIRGIFEEAPKSKVVKFFGDIKYKVGKYFKRFNKQYTEMRKFTNSIDTNA